MTNIELVDRNDPSLNFHKPIEHTNKTAAPRCVPVNMRRLHDVHGWTYRTIAEKLGVGHSSPERWISKNLAPGYAEILAGRYIEDLEKTDTSDTTTFYGRIGTEHYSSLVKIAESLGASLRRFRDD